MSMFELKIELDNDAFAGALDEINNDELAAVIHRVSELMQEVGTHTGLAGNVQDYNGNKVGEWSIN